MRRLAFLAVLMLAVACASGPKPVDGPGEGRTSEAAKIFPVLQLVPNTSLYLVATSRLDHFPTLVRDFLRPLGRVERGADPENIDQELREEIGFSFFNAADLAAAGFAVDQSFALASTNLLPTLYVPVADADKVKEKISSLTRGVTLVVQEHRGVELSVFKQPGDEEFVAWAIWKNHLILHVGIEGFERSTTDWLNELLDSKASVTVEADLDWAYQQAGARKDLLGLARLPQILTVARSLDDAESRTDACNARNDAIARTVGRATVAATIAAGKLDTRAFLELAAPAAADLAAHTAAPPEAAFAAIAAEAGFALGIGVDLDWVGTTFKGYAERECGIALEIIRETDLDEVHDPLREELGARPFSSLHAALLGGTAGLSGVDVQAVGYAKVLDPAAAQQVLGQLGAAQPTQVDGVAAMRLNQPGLAQPIDYVLADGALRVAVGRGLLGKVARGGPPAADAPLALLSFAVRPDKIPDLFSALALVGGREAESLARFLGEYRQMGAVLATEPNGLSLTGGFELR